MFVCVWISKTVDYSCSVCFRLQGYKVSEEGVIEKEDLYLKRMSGIIRLYAAVLQTVNPYPRKVNNIYLSICSCIYMFRICSSIHSSTSMYVAIHLSTCLSIHSFFTKSIYSLCIQLIYLFVCLSVCLSICPSIRLSIHLFIYLSTCIYLSISYTYCLFI